jgi:hypothetical protein
MTSSKLFKNVDARDLETLIADGLDSEAQVAETVAVFSAQARTTAELETLIANALDLI